ncbi:F-box/WD repeat-containing protein [Drosera capensis]
MDRLPVEICHRIFSLLDQQNLASAQQVCRKWKVLASDNNLWESLFNERWGEERSAFYAPTESKSWKDVYEVQDRCDRVGLGVKIVREGVDYYLIYRGEIQRHLGTRSTTNSSYLHDSRSQNGTIEKLGSDSEQEGTNHGVLDKILFFIGDLETASLEAKRSRLA